MMLSRSCGESEGGSGAIDELVKREREGPGWILLFQARLITTLGN